MTDVWKSQARKFCEICKVWFADNKASVEHHEGGARHKAMVAQRLREMSQKKTDADVARTNLAATILAMEQAAHGSGSKGPASVKPESTNVVGPKLPNAPSAAAPAGPSTYFDPKKFKSTTAMAKEMAQRKKEKEAMKKEKEAIKKRMASLKTKSELWDEERPSDAVKPDVAPEEERMEWAEARTDEGKTYYFHIHTGETRWKRPATYFYTVEEYAGLMAKTQAQSLVINNTPQFAAQSYSCKPYVAPGSTAPSASKDVATCAPPPVLQLSQALLEQKSDGEEVASIPVPVNDEETSSIVSARADEGIVRSKKPTVDYPSALEEPVAEQPAAKKKRHQGEKDEKIREIERKIYEERMKVPAFGAWTRVEQVKNDEESKQSPLTARFKQEEEEQKRREEVEAKLHPDDEIDFSEKTLTTSLKKTKPVEFKKRSVGTKNFRSRGDL